MTCYVEAFKDTLPQLFVKLAMLDGERDIFLETSAKQATLPLHAPRNQLRTRAAPWLQRDRSTVQAHNTRRCSPYNHSQVFSF